ncbi:unnamed protein product [Lampetra fluviatilis]
MRGVTWAGDFAAERRLRTHPATGAGQHRHSRRARQPASLLSRPTPQDGVPATGPAVALLRCRLLGAL